MGRYLCEPMHISQRLDRIRSNTTSSKCGVGFRELEKTPSHVFVASDPHAASGQRSLSLCRPATIPPIVRKFVRRTPSPPSRRETLGKRPTFD